MSVIARSLTDNHFVIYTKGAPERIEELCERDSIPKDFSEVLRAYTLRGFRVIGLARRHLPPEVNLVRVGKMKRDQVEQNLVRR
jgi:cation-transporting ATPase 13A2